MRKRNAKQAKSTTRWQQTMTGVLLIGLMLCTVLASYMLLLHFHERPQATTTTRQYLYYVLKTPAGFVLARAGRGPNAQPTEIPQQVASFGEGFGQATTDNILSMQVSPDGHYLAIAGTRSDGDLLWIFDAVRLSLNLEPAHVSGTFLRWLPGSPAVFLYRPMFPLGLEALQGQASWNPGLWKVDAATGTHINLDLHLPSAFLIDASAGPDRKQLIYSLSQGLNMGSEIWSMNNQGGNQARLLALSDNAQGLAGQFTWSPDGQTIAYERLANGPTPFLAAGIWIMDSHGGNQRYLAQADGGHGFALSWSPDNKKLAFVTRTNLHEGQADQSSQSLQSAVEVVNISTGHIQMIGGPSQTGMQMNTNPVWSVDSSQVTFAAYNPLNPVVGGSLHYWSTSLDASATRPAAAPQALTITHVIALS